MYLEAQLDFVCLLKWGDTVSTKSFLHMYITWYWRMNIIYNTYVCITIWLYVYNVDTLDLNNIPLNCPKQKSRGLVDSTRSFLGPPVKKPGLFSEVFAAGDCRRGQSLVVWAIKAESSQCEKIPGYMGASLNGGFPQQPWVFLLKMI